MAIASRWPFSDQMEMLSEKGVSVMGALMESLVGALAGGCSGGRRAAAAAAVVRPLRAPVPVLRLAEGGRGYCRGSTVTK